MGSFTSEILQYACYPPLSLFLLGANILPLILKHGIFCIEVVKVFWQEESYLLWSQCPQQRQH